MTGNYHFFFNCESPFSNFYPVSLYCPILNQHLCSVEHGFIYHKLLVMGDIGKIEELKDLIANDPTYYKFKNTLNYLNTVEWTKLQSAIKKLGREAKGNIKAWDKVKFKVMEELVTLKFNTYPELKKTLLSTKGQFVEASPYDRIWGIGYSKHDALSNINDWGENNLGKILDKVREKLLQEQK